MELAPCLFLLLLPLLGISAIAPESCTSDEDDNHCACNFSDPDPDWSQALICLSSLNVEIRGGGRSLEPFLNRVNLDADPRQYADLIKALRVRRLTVGAARVPALLLFGVLRVLEHSRLKELILEDLEVTGDMPQASLEAKGPALSTLHLRNVSWTTGAWLGELQRWLRSDLKVLSIAQARLPVFSCEQVHTFSALTTLDLSDNPGLGESGLIATLCPHKFPAVQDLALRNAGMETPRGVCAALAEARVLPRRLDLSHNPLRATAAPAARRCAWPSGLDALSLASAGLEQVPEGLPAELRELDLSCNRLTRAPRPDELPKVGKLSLDGNPFLVLGTSNPQGNTENSGAVPACVRSPLAVGMSGTLALLQGGRGFA